MELIIIRGLPGSGKTTYAKTKFPNHKYICADDYFERNGAYRFDLDYVKDAHEWCLERTRQCLKNSENCVVCNTFTKYRYIEPYLNIAPKNCIVKIIRLTSMYISTHGVPGKKIEQMACTMEALHSEILDRLPVNTQIKPKLCYSLTVNDYSRNLNTVEASNWVSIERQRYFIDKVLAPKFLRLQSVKTEYDLAITNIFLIAVFNAYMPPLRYEWADMHIGKSTKRSNYIVIDRTNPGASRIHLCKDMWSNPLIERSLNYFNMQNVDENIVYSKVIVNAIIRSLSSFPRKYILCDNLEGTKPLTISSYKNIVERMYPPKKMNIVLLRRAYVSYIMQYEKQMSGNDMQKICDLMRIADPLTLMFGYSVFQYKV